MSRNKGPKKTRTNITLVRLEILKALAKSHGKTMGEMVDKLIAEANEELNNPQFKAASAINDLIREKRFRINDGKIDHVDNMVQIVATESELIININR